ncbi:unnamed protein product [Soboliphyme baturini]|uniref:Innexin n=1 Tax=Soboliphyme baturini TaxID=241478 RepID=A0A183IN12_9BILA|nr:unnamed protein product [Soboliphyme baturini]
MEYVLDTVSDVFSCSPVKKETLFYMSMICQLVIVPFNGFWFCVLLYLLLCTIAVTLSTVLKHLYMRYIDKTLLVDNGNNGYLNTYNPQYDPYNMTLEALPKSSSIAGLNDALQKLVSLYCLHNLTVIHLPLSDIAYASLRIYRWLKCL